MKKQYLIIILTAAFVSCSKSDMTKMQVQVGDSMIIFPFANHLEDTHLTKLHNDIDKYANFIVTADATIGISSFRQNSQESETIMAYYDPVNEKINRFHECEDFANIFQVNGRNIFAPTTKSGDGYISGLFGNYASFGFQNKINTKSSEPDDEAEEEDSFEIYVPEVMRIEFPSKTLSSESRPLCYYKNFVVRWNKDVNNKNGIIIVVKWRGLMVFGEDYPSALVQHIARFQDSGEIELDESMFEGIPDTAYCTLIVFRGDVENVEINETNYKYLTECYDMLDFVLVRHIE